MGLTANQMITRVHGLLNQDPARTTNYVTDTMILDYLNEGINIACKLGRIYDTTVSATTDSSGRVPISTLETSTPLAITNIYVVDIANVYNASGEALTKIDPKDRGRVFQGIETGAAATDVLYYYKFGNYIYTLPYYTGTVLTFELYSQPQGLLVKTADIAATAKKRYAGVTQEATTLYATFATASAHSLTDGMRVHNTDDAHYEYDGDFYVYGSIDTNPYTYQLTTRVGDITGIVPFHADSTGTTTVYNTANFDTPPFDDTYHAYLPIYAAFRGKQAYNSHQEARTYLDQFSQLIGIDRAEIEPSTQPAKGGA